MVAFVAITFVVGLTLDGRGEQLGTPRPPLLFDVDPRAALGWALLAGAVLVAALVVAPRITALRPAPFAAAIFALALGARLAVAAARSGPSAWDAPFDESFEAKNEYVPALPALDNGVGWFLDRFAELVPALPVHSAGHPPGLLVTLHALGIDSAEGAAALVILLGTLAVPLTYALARRLLDDDRAKIAGLLAVFAPATSIFGVTSADAAYATLGAAAAVLLLTSRFAGAAALAVASFFSYALLAIGAWAALVEAARRGWRAGVALAGACAVALVVFYAGLYALTGFELGATLRATEEVYGNSVARLRPYEFWVFGSPAAFLAFLGLPIAWYAAGSAAARHPAALALVAVIVISAVGGFTKAETERIWLMYVPLACVAAATVIPPRHLKAVLAALAVQTLAVELLFGTVW